ncbi:MFS transporter [Scytonema sp. UIC 10036]|uniref:MFS transporter n=1 Tax=Scytonema sp. UIC 10036 TaxID=2304196 RepID=UPI0012DA0231|nr:MFS transporter [Scytonema sp. UIC 10036]MUG92872.1 MFS transporter [Scytonema sp. UIC 10036]
MAKHPLQIPNFRLLWLGQSLILCAVQFWVVALTWLVLQKTGSGVAIGTVLLAAAVPRALLTLVGGALSDRLSPYRIATFSAITNTILVGTVAALLWYDTIQFQYLIIVAGVFGISDAFLYPATLSALPRLIDKSLLMKANALMQGGEQITNVIGSAAAGLAIGTFGLPIAFTINTVLFALGGLFLYFIRQPKNVQNSSTTPSIQQLLGEIAEGIRYAWKNPPIRISLLITAMLNLATLGPLVVGVAKLVELRFGGSATTYGYIQAAFGVGAFLGVLAASQINSVKTPRMTLVLLAYGLGIGTTGLGFVQQAWMAYGLIALMGLGGGFVSVIAIGWLQEQTVAEMQGRMMGLLTFTAVALDPFSQAASGFLMDINLTLMFVVAGATMLLTAVITPFSSTNI